ncbi:GNAT family N-acetyltransferase [Neobacillus rhizosphaerae]|uniref:GNAT family N-acetyltransferase n=1 Tax=Neobacillus rhizosphaerae TaxID=2880965 RepID=UPI0038736B50
MAQKSPINNDEGFIYDFIGFEQYHGLGYGKKAMNEIEIIAKELGMKNMHFLFLIKTKLHVDYMKSWAMK